MAMDLTVTSYPTYDDLLDYMEGSAAVIGTMMLPILGSPDPAAAREPARQLGLAFQLTNFIRDVAEDLDRGRVYLPDEDLAEFGVTRADLADATAGTTPKIKDLIAYEVERAREHYAAAAPGIPCSSPASQACMRTAYPLYGGILDEVDAAGYDVFARRATVPEPPPGRGRRASPAHPARHPGAPPPGHGHAGGGVMRTAVVLFTRDLRVHDNPALAAACANAEQVVPLFVLDPALAGLSPNRDRFLHQGLADLRETLRDRGGDLVVRDRRPGRRDDQAGRRGRRRRASALAADVSAYARRRRAAARATSASGTGSSLRLFPGVTVVDPGACGPAAAATTTRSSRPYHRAWQAAKWRDEVAAPQTITLPDGRRRRAAAGAAGRRVARRGARRRDRGPAAARRPGCEHVDAVRRPARRPGRATAPRGSARTCASVVSRRWPWRTRRRPAAVRTPFVRQLCWRDFYYQVTRRVPGDLHARRTAGPATVELARRRRRACGTGRTG